MDRDADEVKYELFTCVTNLFYFISYRIIVYGKLYINPYFLHCFICIINVVLT